MDLRQLKYFIAIVEQGSFSKAAAVLNVAQPSLSLHVRNMEAELNVALLLRQPNGIIPTESGEILLENARFIIGQFDQTIDKIQDNISEPSGLVKLGLPSEMCEILAVPLIMKTAELFPKITLCIREALSGYILEWLNEEQLDLTVLYEKKIDKNLFSQPILSEELVLFSHKSNPNWNGKAAISFREICNLPLILPSKRHGLRVLLEDYAVKKDLQFSAKVLVDSHVSIKRLVENEFGYSILPLSAIQDEVSQGKFQYWPIEDEGIRRDVKLVHLSNQPLSNSTAAVKKILIQVLRELVETGAWKGAILSNEQTILPDLKKALKSQN